MTRMYYTLMSYKVLLRPVDQPCAGSVVVRGWNTVPGIAGLNAHFEGAECVARQGFEQ
jgi:hypothetical protein